LRRTSASSSPACRWFWWGDYSARGWRGLRLLKIISSRKGRKERKEKLKRNLNKTKTGTEIKGTDVQDPVTNGECGFD
jgi:hypothetical protein